MHSVARRRRSARPKQATNRLNVRRGCRSYPRNTYRHRSAAVGTSPAGGQDQGPRAGVPGQRQLRILQHLAELEFQIDVNSRGVLRNVALSGTGRAVSKTPRPCSARGTGGAPLPKDDTTGVVTLASTW